MSMGPDQSHSVVLIHGKPNKISEGQAKILSLLLRRGRIRTNGLCKNEINNLAKLQMMGVIEPGDQSNLFVLKPGITLEGDL